MNAATTQANTGRRMKNWGMEGSWALALRADGSQRGAEAAAPAQTPAWAQEDEIAPDDEAEATTAPLRGTVEPDPVWADAAEASVLAALAKPDAADDDAAEDDDGAFDQAMRFDEDVLRELVRDMLREELAGKMGERITRNIRKLVRAEIARALAAQEFE